MRFSLILVIGIVVLSLINFFSYFINYHTYNNGIGVKYNDELSQIAFIENLKYYGISYKIREENVVWFTKSNEDTVEKISKKINYKLVRKTDIDLEVNKLKLNGLNVSIINYPRENYILVMWHDENSF